MVWRLSSDLNQLRADLVALVYCAESFPAWDDLPVHTQEIDDVWSECKAMHDLWMEFVA